MLFSEPKIPQLPFAGVEKLVILAEFQCSSASRKFLNLRRASLPPSSRHRFSALQRAENSSSSSCCTTSGFFRVSVLFSEPKIPQFSSRTRRYGRGWRFQCSSASRKFLNAAGIGRCVSLQKVSVLFSEPKIPQSDPRTCVHPYSRLRRSRFVVPEPSWCVAMTPVY